jgi:hypothetical protein
MAENAKRVSVPSVSAQAKHRQSVSAGNRRSDIIKFGVASPRKSSAAGGTRASISRSSISPEASPNRDPSREWEAAAASTAASFVPNVPRRVINAPRAQIAQVKRDFYDWEDSRMEMVKYLGDAVHDTLQLEAKLEAVFAAEDHEHAGRIDESGLMCERRPTKHTCACAGLHAHACAHRAALREMGLDLHRAEVKQLIDEVCTHAHAQVIPRARKHTCTHTFTRTHTHRSASPSPKAAPST